MLTRWAWLKPCDGANDLLTMASSVLAKYCDASIPTRSCHSPISNPNSRSVVSSGLRFRLPG
jgi:hypothetical protein